MAKKETNSTFMQVCRECGSNNVYRQKWVNVNTEEIGNSIYIDNHLEWCLDCNTETKIMEVLEYFKHYVNSNKKI